MDVLVFKEFFLLAERMQLQTHNIIFYTISLISFYLIWRCKLNFPTEHRACAAKM